MDPSRMIALEDFTGQVVVINVWGQWCGPCRTEMPELQRVYNATRTAGVAFLGIDVRDNNRQAAVDFIVDRKVTFPSIYDPPMRTMIALGARYPTTVIPSTIVLDRAHRVAAVFLRALLAEDLEPVVRRLAVEPPPTPGHHSERRLRATSLARRTVIGQVALLRRHRRYRRCLAGCRRRFRFFPWWRSAWRCGICWPFESSGRTAGNGRGCELRVSWLGASPWRR